MRWLWKENFPFSIFKLLSNRTFKMKNGFNSFCISFSCIRKTLTTFFLICFFNVARFQSWRVNGIKFFPKILSWSCRKTDRWNKLCNHHYAVRSQGLRDSNVTSMSWKRKEVLENCLIKSSVISKVLFNESHLSSNGGKANDKDCNVSNLSFKMAAVQCGLKSFSNITRPYNRLFSSLKPLTHSFKDKFKPLDCSNVNKYRFTYIGSCLCHCRLKFTLTHADDVRTR